MEQLFFFSFLISRGSKYAHYYLLQAKMQLSWGILFKYFSSTPWKLQLSLRRWGGWSTGIREGTIIIVHMLLLSIFMCL